ncbi:hypothetical protein [Undibacterium terreum]|uniref:Uncharacterized protein n=1 Tax=Undibacterium terreum TaxID=1224302 RepID=A0A916U2F7_9BURK|nr:hypothetical protein [Undibacterium terreum]GGC57950.1 hypothetical protein GCM10011396_00950 [Undibacterium terreum]
MKIAATQDINRLIGEYLYLEERWQDDPSRFQWTELEALAEAGASAYNEGKGLSFHILALDGMDHNEFHENFLRYSLAAGFDPFKVVHTGNGNTLTTVLNHRNLAENAQHNATSARMQILLQDKARERFAVEEAGADENLSEIATVIALCADSIPKDLLEQLVLKDAAIH